MSGLLPVTAIVHTGKTKNAISQQLMDRFHSSFEELKIEALPLRLQDCHFQLYQT